MKITKTTQIINTLKIPEDKFDGIMVLIDSELCIQGAFATNRSIGDDNCVPQVEISDPVDLHAEINSSDEDVSEYAEAIASMNVLLNVIRQTDPDHDQEWFIEVE